jgi:RHS repeat-associated protein
VDHVTYDPYGNSVSTSGSLTTNLKFCGQYLDSESGLYQLRARYYDPATAQFTTRDPLVSKTRSPYAYVAGDPLNAIDPSGRDTGQVTYSPDGTAQTSFPNYGLTVTVRPDGRYTVTYFGTSPIAYYYGYAGIVGGDVKAAPCFSDWVIYSGSIPNLQAATHTSTTGTPEIPVDFQFNDAFGSDDTIIQGFVAAPTRIAPPDDGRRLWNPFSWF